MMGSLYSEFYMCTETNVHHCYVGRGAPCWALNSQPLNKSCFISQRPGSTLHATYLYILPKELSTRTCQDPQQGLLAIRRTRHAPTKCCMWPASGNKAVWAKGWGYVLPVTWSDGVLAQQLLLPHARCWKLGSYCETMHISPLRFFLFLMQGKK